MEDEIFRTDYIGKSLKKHDIITKLGSLHASLEKLGQDETNRPKALNIIAAQLVSSKFLGSTDKEVRLLTCCCIVDILRIYAPEAPYNDDELLNIFDVISAQLKTLCTYDTSSTIGSKLYYILKSLSTVKSCVVLVCLDQGPSSPAHELLLSFFDALVSSIRPEHGEEVAGHIGNILQSCIEETSSVDVDLLDVLLQPLLPTAKIENLAAYRLSQSVLVGTAHILQLPISNLINHILVGTLSEDKDEGSVLGGMTQSISELSDHVYPVIYELHKISPGLLLRILPNICIQLHAENEDVRMKAVKLLGLLFASPHAEYGAEYARNFKEFLGRCVDISPSIRLEMCVSMGLIVKNKPNLVLQVEDCYLKRLRDADNNVRLESLTRMVEIAYDNPLTWSVGSYKEIFDRVKDKKPNIRRYAVLWISKIYSKFISSQILPIHPKDSTGTGNGGGNGGSSVSGDRRLSSASTSSTQSKTGSTDKKSRLSTESVTFVNYTPFAGISNMNDLWRRLRHIPSIVVQYWGYPDSADKQLTLQMLQEVILPRPSSHESSADKASIANKDSGEKSSFYIAEWEGKRAALLLFLYSMLTTNSERQSFSSILQHKSKISQALTQYLQQWASLTASSKGSRRPSVSGGEVGVGGGTHDLVSTVDAVTMQRAAFRLLQVLPAPAAGTERKGQAVISLDKVISSNRQSIYAPHSTRKSSIARRNSSLASGSSNVALVLNEGDDVCICSAMNQRDDLKQKFNSKSPLGEYLGYLYDTSAIHMLADISCIEYLLGIVTNESVSGQYVKGLDIMTEMAEKEATPSSDESENDVDDCCSILAAHQTMVYNSTHLLASLSRFFPSIFRDSPLHIERWIQRILRKIDDSKDKHTTSTGKKSLFCLLELEQCILVIKNASKAMAQEQPKLCFGLFRALLDNAINIYSQANICSLLAEAMHALLSALRQSQSNLLLTESPNENETDINAEDIEVLIVESINDLVARLTPASSFSQISCSLHLIAPLLGLVSGVEMKSLYSKILRFLKKYIFSENSLISFSSSSAKSSAEEEEQKISCLRGGLKVWAEMLVREAARDRLSTLTRGEKSMGEHNERSEEELLRFLSTPLSDRFPKEIAELLTILFDCISCNGCKVSHVRIFDKSPTSAHHHSLASCMREVSLCSVLELLKIKIVNKFLNSAEWLQIGWKFLDQNFDCRKSFITTFRDLIQTYCVHPRFLVYPMLLSCDEKLSQSAEQIVLFAVKRLRATHIEICAKAMTMEDLNSPEGLAIQGIAEDTMPECMLPYLIYILAHHPNFPEHVDISGEGDSARMKSIVKSIKMLVSSLVTTLTEQDQLTAGSSVSFMMKQVSIILQYYRDRQDQLQGTDYNAKIELVAKTVMKVLESHVKTIEYSQPFSGDISLPIDLYYAIEDDDLLETNKAKQKGISKDKKISSRNHEIIKKDHAKENLSNKKSEHMIEAYVNDFSKENSMRRKGSSSSAKGVVSAKRGLKEINSNAVNVVKKTKSDSSVRDTSKQVSAAILDRNRPAPAPPARSSSRLEGRSSVSYAEPKDSDLDKEMELHEKLLEEKSRSSRSGKSSSSSLSPFSGSTDRYFHLVANTGDGEQSLELGKSSRTSFSISEEEEFVPFPKPNAHLLSVMAKRRRVSSLSSSDDLSSPFESRSDRLSVGSTKTYDSKLSRKSMMTDDISMEEETETTSEHMNRKKSSTANGKANPSISSGKGGGARNISTARKSTANSTTNSKVQVPAGQAGAGGKSLSLAKSSETSSDMDMDEYDMEDKYHHVQSKRNRALTEESSSQDQVEKNNLFEVFKKPKKGRNKK